jgi:hypothetical protein
VIALANKLDKKVMKKIILILLVLVASTTATLVSCKKENKQSEKERVQSLLTSSKWFYQSLKNVTPGVIGKTETCFNEKRYWEFKADGTYADTWDLGSSGAFELSADGKTITLNQKKSGTITITKIDSNSFYFTIKFDGGAAYELVLNKKASTCTKA